MTERPILFSEPMVRAILAGKKTMTRRVVTKPRTGMGNLLSPEFWDSKRPGAWSAYDGDLQEEIEISCPYGEPGDRLWVREAFASGAEDGPDPIRWLYRADGEFPGATWKPSIHMPRAVSRIDLEVTGVRVERLQEISEEDAEAEGVESRRRRGTRDESGFVIPARDRFRDLWESINPKRGYGWDANPWVWCVEFRRVRP